MPKNGVTKKNKKLLDMVDTSKLGKGSKAKPSPKKKAAPKKKK